MSSVPQDQATRRSVASYSTYVEAQQAVDHLADSTFPVERLSIVGEGLRFVEDVTGRAGYARAAVSGLVSGAATGALIGFVLGLLTVFQPLTSALALALWGALIGAVVGMVSGLLGRALSSRRDFSSVQTMRAQRYCLLADEPVADRAAAALSGRRGAAGSPDVPRR